MTYWSTPVSVTVGEVAASADFNDHQQLINFLGNPPSQRLYVSDEFPVPSGEWTDVPMNRTDWQVNGMSNDANAIVIPTTAYYVVTGQCQFVGFSGNPTLVMVGLYSADNGVVVRVLGGMGANEGQGPVPGGTSRVLLAAGDQVKLQVWHNSVDTEYCTGAEPGASNFIEVTWAFNFCNGHRDEEHHMTYPYWNVFAIGGVGVNGATVYAYDVSRFTGQPSLGTPVPGGAADAGPVTTGDTFGSDGAFVIDLPTTDEFYIAISYSAETYWAGPVVGAGAGGSGGGGGGGNGEVLNSVAYGPTSPASYTPTTTLAALDTTHLTLSFTVPADGQVTIEVDLSADIAVDSGTGAELELAFFEHGTTTLAAPREIVLSSSQTASTDYQIGGRWTYKATVTGLTANASLQWDLAAVNPNGSGGAIIAADDGTTGSNANGPILITAYGPATDGGSGLPLTGGTLTGTVYQETSGDAFTRRELDASGTSSISTPFAPVNMGLHASGDVGSGTDVQQYIESLSDTAFIEIVSFPRNWVTDGTHYGYLSSVPFNEMALNTSQYVTLTSGTASALASSGTLTVKSVLFGNGTLSYTGKTTVSTTEVTLTGCTSTGIAVQSDTSERYARATTDSYGNVIELTGDYGGHQVNDFIRFVYNGDFLSNDLYDIYLGFFDDVNRDSGSAVFWGSDGNVFAYRTNAFAANMWNLSVDTNLLTFDVNGLYAGSALGLGTLLNRWGVGYLSGLNTAIVAKSAAYTATAADSTIVVTGTTTITLPDATTVSGREYTIVNVGANVVTIATTSSQDINGATTYTLLTQYSGVTVQSNGTGWITTSGTGSGGGGGSSLVPANLQTASYVPVASDNLKVIEMNSSSATTVTLNAGVFSAGDTFEVCQVGSGAVSFVGGGGTPSISLVANTNNDGNGLSTLALDPAAVGNVQLLAVYTGSATISASSLSGGGCATWTQIGTGQVGTDTTETTQIFMGTVTTAGSSTVTITWSSTIGTTFVDLSCHEFSSGMGTSTSWALDVHGTVNTTSTSTAVTFPSLTATGSNELYFGMVYGTQTTVAGSTTNFAYYGGTTKELMAWDTGATGTLAPTATLSTAGYYSGIAGILIASGSGVTIDSYNDYLQLLGQWASATVRYRSGTEAVISGALT